MFVAFLNGRREEIEFEWRWTDAGRVAEILFLLLDGLDEAVVYAVGIRSREARIARSFSLLSTKREILSLRDCL
jgi:hypothetical protein